MTSTTLPAEVKKRVAGNMENYIKAGNDQYVCKDCGATILGARVAHPIHLKEMPGAGFGNCEYKTVPFCPNCEEQPSYHGTPILV